MTKMTVKRNYTYIKRNKKIPMITYTDGTVVPMDTNNNNQLIVNPTRLISKKTPNYHHFKRSFKKIDISIVGSAYGLGYAFRFNELPNSTEFSSLFEQYRLDSVKIKFFYSIDAVTTNAGSNGFLYYFLDMNDANNPSSVNEFYETNYKQLPLTKCDGTKQANIYFRPRVSNEVYRSLTTTSYATPNKNPWLDLSYTDVPHFALKIGWDGNASSGSLRGICTYYFTCRYLK